MLVHAVLAGVESVQIWDVATGTRTTSALPASSVFEGAVWINNGFRLLLRAGGLVRETDELFGNPVTYSPQLPLRGTAWVPARSASFVASLGRCLEIDGDACIREHKLSFVSPGSDELFLGQFMGETGGLFIASPSGEWLAYQPFTTRPPIILQNPFP